MYMCVCVCVCVSIYIYIYIYIVEIQIEKLNLKGIQCYNVSVIVKQHQDLGGG